LFHYKITLPKQSSIISVGLFCNETIVQRYHSARAHNNYFEQLKQLPRTPISDSRKKTNPAVYLGDEENK